MDKYTIQDLILSAADQKPDDFAQGFNSLMIDKLNDAIDVKKQEMAQFMFSDTDEISDDENAEYESEINSED
jgi:hypothetical protein